MRRFSALLLIASVAAVSPAWAADLPAQAPVMVPTYKAPVVAPFSWTGFYVGAHAGYGWSSFSGTDSTDGTTTTTDAKGALGGGQIGFNYQMGAVVLGVEGDFAASGVKVDASSPDPFPGLSLTGTLKNDWFGTAAGRFGWALDHTLFYGKGGAAWTRDKIDISAADGSTATGSFMRSGWMAGAGVEYAFTSNVTAKLEYNYLDFGAINEQPTTTGALMVDSASVKLHTSIVKIGINYLFH
jgi:outer membrane immunogenic protein